MKQYGFKQVLSLMLALVMCFGMLPVSAFAAETKPEAGQTQQTSQPEKKQETKPAPQPEKKQETAKPTPEKKDEVKNPAPEKKDETKKPVPEKKDEVVNPAPEKKDEVINPAPEKKDETKKPVPEKKDEVVNPAPEKKDEVVNPTPEKKDETRNPVPEKKDEVVNPAPEKKDEVQQPEPVEQELPMLLGAAPTEKQVIVTFTVVNGTWEGGGTEKSVQLTIPADADNVPVTGVPTPVPNAGYQAGQWNPSRPAGASVSADTTYTYQCTPTDYTLTAKGCTLEKNGQTFKDSVTAHVDDQIKVTAPAMQGEKSFYAWNAEGIQAGPDSEITVTMAAGNAKLTPQYKMKYLLTVDNGDPSDDREVFEGESVTLNPGTIPEGKIFKKWVVSPEKFASCVADPTQASARLTMPAGAVTVTAEYTPVYTVNHVMGNVSPDKNVEAGTSVRVTTPDPEGLTFVRWEAEGVQLEDPTDMFFQFDMPANDVTLRAVYTTDVTFEVRNGSFADGKTQVVKTVEVPNGTGPLGAVAPTPVPNNGYGFGYWVNEPTADTVITGPTTFTHTFRTLTEVSAEILWMLDDKTPMEHPTDVTGVTVDVMKMETKVATLTEPDLTAKLPMHDLDYSTIMYKLKAGEVPGFTSAVDGDVVTYTAEPVSVTVKLDDSVVIPDDVTQVEVTLQGLPQKAAPQLILNKANGWTASVDGLPRYAPDGTPLAYRPSFASGLNLKVTGSQKDGFVLSPKAMKTLTAKVAWQDPDGNALKTHDPITVTVDDAARPEYSETIRITGESGSLTVPAADLMGNALRYELYISNPNPALWQLIGSDVAEDALDVTLRQLRTLTFTAKFMHTDGSPLTWPEGEEVRVGLVGSSETLSLTAGKPSGSLTVPSADSRGNTIDYVPSVNTPMPEGIPLSSPETSGSMADGFVFTYRVQGRLTVTAEFLDADGKPLDEKLMPEKVETLVSYGERTAVEFLRKDRKWTLEDDITDAPLAVEAVGIPGFTASVTEVQKGPDAFAYKLTYQQNKDARDITVDVAVNCGGKDLPFLPFGNTVQVKVLKDGEPFKTMTFLEGVTRQTFSVPKDDKSEYTVTASDLPDFDKKITGSEETGFTVRYNAQLKDFTVELDPDSVLPDSIREIKVKVSMTAGTPGPLSADGHLLAIGPMGGSEVFVLKRANGFRQIKKLPVYNGYGERVTYDAELLSPKKKGLSLDRSEDRRIRILSDYLMEEVEITVSFQDSEKKPIAAPSALKTLVAVAHCKGFQDRMLKLTADQGFAGKMKVLKGRETTFALQQVPGFKQVQGGPNFILQHEAGIRETETLKVTFHDSQGAMTAWPKGITQITAKLQQNGAAYQGVTVKAPVEGNVGTLELKLPDVDVSGKPFVYKVTDPAAVPGYTALVEGYSISYYKDARIDITVRWEDEKGVEIPAPGTVSGVKVFLRDRDTSRELEIKGASWKYTETLPGGNPPVALTPITAVEGFKSSVATPKDEKDPDHYQFQVIYRRNQNIGNFHVATRWNYNGHISDKMPEDVSSVRIYLYRTTDPASGKYQYYKTEILVKGETARDVEYEKKDASGKPYTYILSQLKAPHGFDPKVAVAGNQNTGFTVTYKAVPVPTSIRLATDLITTPSTKINATLKDSDGNVVAKVLFAEGKRVADAIKVNKYDNDGNLLSYTVEVDPGYTVTGNVQKGFVIHGEVANKTLEVTIVWKDKNGKVTEAPTLHRNVNILITGKVGDKTVYLRKETVKNGSGDFSVPIQDVEGNQIQYNVTLVSPITNYSPSFNWLSPNHMQITLRAQKLSLIPRTSDDRGVAIWAGVAVASLVALGAVLVITKKKKDQK